MARTHIVHIDGEKVRTVNRSLRVHEAIEERSTASFQVEDLAEAHQFEKGQPVVIWGEDGFRIFGGVVDSSQEEVVAPGGGFIHHVKCADNHYYADKRVVSEAYTEELAGDIVRDIFTTYLQPEGIRIAEWDDGDELTAFVMSQFPAEFEGGEFIADGGIVREAIFNYVPASQALDALAEQANFWWGIDPHKRLFFLPRDARGAAWMLTRDRAIKGSVRVIRGNPKYRNRQYIRGGKGETDPQTETRQGDGETQSFAMGFPLNREPTIEVDRGSGFVQETVGIKGVDEDKQWYWSKGDAIITQEREDTPLTATDTLRVTYRGQFPIVFQMSQPDEVGERQAVEGGTGLVESVFDAPEIDSRDAAGELASKKLTRLATIGRTVQFATWLPGLEPGQLLTVDLPDYRVTGAEMLIESVDISDEVTHLRYTVKAVEGPTMGSWTKFFAEIERRAKLPVIHENVSEQDVLVILEQYQKQWEETDPPPNIFERALVGTAQAGFAHAGFAAGDEVKFIAWYDGATELGRKAITQFDYRQGGMDLETTEANKLLADEIFSLHVLNPLEAVGTITHFGWWGGWQATHDAGTGLELDKQVYARGEKTVLEQLLVEHRHLRWEDA